MKDLFDRHQDKLTESEDRRVWTAMRGAMQHKTPWWRRPLVPSLAAAGAVAVVAFALLGPDVMQRGGTDYLADRTDVAARQAPAPAAGPATPGYREESAADAEAPAPPGVNQSADGAAGTARDRTQPETAESGSEAAPETAKSRMDGHAANAKDAMHADEDAVSVEAYDEITPAPGKPLVRPQLADNAARERRDYPASMKVESGVIRGRVVDPEGKPLRFAFVSVTGAEATALTGENGEFELTGVPPGEHVLHVEYAGLDPFSMEVRVEDLPLLAEIAMTDLNAQGVFAMGNEGDEKKDRDRDQADKAEMRAVPYLTGGAASSVKQGKEQAEAEALRQSVEAYGRSGVEMEAHALTGGFSADHGAAGAAPSGPQEPSPAGRHPISVGGTDPVNDEAYDAMFFRNYGVNPFVDAADDALATFAVDVDNGSYTLARAYLQDGNLPPRDAIRVEEFINAIEHRYPAPGSHLTASRAPVPSEHGTFAIYLDAAPSPFGDGLSLLRVGLKGREIDTEDRKPANLTFVVDVSGSMNREDRLGLVKQSLVLLLDEMRRDDRVGIVVYGTTARMVLPHTSLDRRNVIERAIEGLVAEGSTNAEAGLRQGYALADRVYREGWINRVILCSDGVANVGRTGPESILNEIKREARRGIYMTAVGFGMGNYNDVLMEQLADQGDGHYVYVDDLREAERVFVTNLNGTLQTIAREVKIQVEFDPESVERYRLLGYENRDVADEDFRNDKVDAGEVGAGHEVTALFEMKLKDARRRGPVATVRIRYEDPETGKVTEEARALEYADMESSFMNPDPTFRLDAAVAEFAEILRGSYWAKDGNLAQAAGLARSASRQIGDPEQAAEMVRLMESALNLWPMNEPTPWRDDPRFQEEDQ